MVVTIGGIGRKTKLWLNKQTEIIKVNVTALRITLGFLIQVISVFSWSLKRDNPSKLTMSSN